MNSTKVYFAPNWGQTPKEMLKDYSLQSPEGSGKWQDIEATTNLEDAEFLVIQDNCDPILLNKFPKERRLYFSREALDLSSHRKYPPSLVERSSFWDNGSIRISLREA